MSYNRKTIVTDEYRYENETTVKYAPPRYIPLKRTPSLTSIITVNTSAAAPCRPRSCLRRAASIRRADESLTIEADNDSITITTPAPAPPRCSRLTRFQDDSDNDQRSLTTCLSYKSNDNLCNTTDYSLKYEHKEIIESRPPPPPPPPALIRRQSSRTNISKIDNNTTTTTTTTTYTTEEPQLPPPPPPAPAPKATTTYIYNSDLDNRQVTYIRQTDDQGLSLPGCLVKASETFQPCTRSVNLGAIFNGSSFGLLSNLRDNEEIRITYY